jgi:hypothetical protein
MTCTLEKQGAQGASGLCEAGRIYLWGLSAVEFGGVETGMTRKLPGRATLWPLPCMALRCL